LPHPDFSLMIPGMSLTALSAVSDSRSTPPPKRRSAVTNGSRLHVQPVGDTAWSRRFADVLGEIIGDLGGPDGLSEGQRQLARRAATLSLECERLEVRALSGRSMIESLPSHDGLTPLQILQESSKVLHALARHGIGGDRVAALAEKPRDEQDRIVSLLEKAADIAAKAHVAAGQAIDLEVYGFLCNSLSRVFVRLGLERRPREINGQTLDELQREERGAIDGD
jgi:hypothetical protein